MSHVSACRGRRCPVPHAEGVFRPWPAADTGISRPADEGIPGAVGPGDRRSLSRGPGIARAAPGPLDLTCGTRGAEALCVSASLGHHGTVSAATRAAVPCQADSRTSEPQAGPARGGCSRIGPDRAASAASRGPLVPARAPTCLPVALTCRRAAQASAVSGSSSPETVLRPAKAGRGLCTTGPQRAAGQVGPLRVPGRRGLRGGGTGRERRDGVQPRGRAPRGAGSPEDGCRATRTCRRDPGLRRRASLHASSWTEFRVFSGTHANKFSSRHRTEPDR